MLAVIGNLAGVGDSMHRVLQSVGYNSTRIDLVYGDEPSQQFDGGRTSGVIRLSVGSKREYLRSAQFLSRNFTAVLSVGFGGLQVLPFLRIPYLLVALGSDLREMAAGLGSYSYRRVALARYVIRRAALVLHSPDAGHVQALDKIGCRSRAIFRQPLSREIWLAPKCNPRYDGAYRVFHPASHRWLQRFDGDYSKGNDLAIRGISMAAANGVPIHATLLRRGRDWEATEKLIESLATPGVFEWQEPPRSREEYVSLLDSQDLVVDQIGSGAFGLVTLESLARGKKVLSSGNRSLLTSSYGRQAEIIPIGFCQTDWDVTVGVYDAYSSRAEDQARAAELRDWVRKCHGDPELGTLYSELFNAHIHGNS